MTNIAICGASGHMGRVIADIIANRSDCTVVAGIDKVTQSYADFPIVENPDALPVKPDVIIDFSHPSTLDGLLSYCLTNGVPVVVATTGYTADQIAQIKKAAESIPVFFTFNMSLGINLLAELAKKAASVLEGQFDIEIVEKHHNQKLDAPSGTAIMLADAINETLETKCTYTYDRHSVRAKRTKTEIGMHSIRGGTIVGEHEIIFAGRDEVVSLKHEAHSKSVFAVGSVNAAVFLKTKGAGLYAMSDMLKEV
ncbi:dihydrodipicolinate reductase [Ruminococcus sp. YE71]|uniref:4-hydroxy-tetrahydrodipicolinate reductase n=1 Tax=unclassified Ruminococcus TaxID=2608920 RepID=UPI00088FA891|nr:MULTISPECIES: 4-hydroxy-tetrahydrodipicolinate reductase [unclassified Ruminococcus]SDA24139.1 dihydrodipicolinate reductase [Ruminococcus sp. YE78]SFW41371.1 dihydrodipicolinate reductase [Ruminococcus sp. YE71]